MHSAIAYDVTRLLLRACIPTPNGIDRVDLAYARHFLGESQLDPFGVFLNRFRPAIIASQALAGGLAGIERNWAGEDSTQIDARFAAIKAAIVSRDDPARFALPPSASRRKSIGQISREASNIIRLLSPRVIPRGLFRTLPTGAVFIHTTHYPFESYFRWLEDRSDIKSVFFVHDLLPLSHPEFFEERHADWHRRSLYILARHGHGAIVSSKSVEHQLREFLKLNGRTDMPILVEPLPPSPAFVGKNYIDDELRNQLYFVMIGTIEPRKNHLTILNVWRELIGQFGARAPKLVIIGNRGWKNENVVEILDRSVAHRGHVIEAADLQDRTVARLLANARALLMPSFAEGYGLPIIEAQALDVPVIASDIAVFREVAKDAWFVDPRDGNGWLAAVQRFSSQIVESKSKPLDSQQQTTGQYFDRVEAFIDSLSTAPAR